MGLPRRRRGLGWAAFGIASLLTLLQVVPWPGFADPPIPGDGPDYEMIGFHLAHGHGFSRGVLDEATRPYREHPDRERYWFVQSDPPGDFAALAAMKGPTAVRPPLLPCVIAAGYVLFGRDFRPLRVVNALALAGAASIALALALRAGGPAAAAVAAALMVAFGFDLAWVVRRYLTEALACLLAALLAWQLCHPPPWSRARAAWLGATLALSILNRSLMVVWLPFVLLALVWLASAPGPGSRRARAARAPLVAGAVCALLLLPWAARNVIVTGRAMPLGTQGAMILPAQYGDEALASWGVWTSLEERGFFAPVLETASGPPARQEAAMADYARRVASAWIAENWSAIPRLVRYRVVGEYWPPDPFDRVVHVFALVALALAWRRREVRVLAGLVAINAVGIALTHTVGGRFLVPVLPLSLALSGIGIAALGHLAVRAGSRAVRGSRA